MNQVKIQKKTLHFKKLSKIVNPQSAKDYKKWSIKQNL